MEKKKSITIFSQELCAKLMLAGHKLQGMKQDRLYPERNVFFFRNDENVLKDMRKILDN